MFPISFCKWVFFKHREDAWVYRFSTLRISALNKLWIQRCSMLNESKFGTIRVEDHKTLQHNVREVFYSHDIFPPILETHHDNVDHMPSEILRPFLCEFYDIVKYFDSSDKLTNNTFNISTNFLPKISESASKMSNTATKLRHMHTTVP